MAVLRHMLVHDGHHSWGTQVSSFSCSWGLDAPAHDCCACGSQWPPSMDGQGHFSTLYLVCFALLLFVPHSLAREGSECVTKSQRGGPLARIFTQSKANQTNNSKIKTTKVHGVHCGHLSLPLAFFGWLFHAAAAQSEGCRHQHRMLLLNIEASLRRTPPPSCSSDGVLRFSWLISGDFSSENVQFCGHHWARWVGGASAVCGWQGRVRRRPRRTQSGA